jgi:hypothetical protein
MSQNKKTGIEYWYDSEKIPPNKPAETTEAEFLPLDNSVRSIREHIVYKTTDAMTVDLLARHHLEYQQLMALHSGEPIYRGLSYAQVKRNLRNIIDTHWDLYKRRFSIPDHLVSMKFTCLEGEFFLGLNNGYLCFYKDPNFKFRTPYPLVMAEDDQVKPSSN